MATKAEQGAVDRAIAARWLLVPPDLACPGAAASGVFVHPVLAERRLLVPPDLAARPRTAASAPSAPETR